MVAAEAPLESDSSVPVNSPSAIVPALGVAQIFGWGSSYYLLGALTQSIAEETGWSNAWILAGLSLALLVAGVISPQMGRAVSRRGGRALLSWSTLLLAAGLLILANAHGPLIYALGWTIMGLGMGLGLYDAAFATLGACFGAASRGPITALTLIAGFSSTLTWPLSLFLLGQVGWRGTCVAYALIEVLLCLPLYLLFLPSAAEFARPHTVAPTPSTKPQNVDRKFYALGAILTLTSAVAAILSVNLILIITALGVASATAAGLSTLLGPAQVLARVAEMVFSRHYHPTVTLALATGSLATGIVLFLFGHGAIPLAVLLYGGGVGVAWVARGTVPMAIFGPETYAAQLGRLARPALIAQAVAPTVGGYFIEEAGIVRTLIALVVAASGAFVLAIMLARQSIPDRTQVR